MNIIWHYRNFNQKINLQFGFLKYFDCGFSDKFCGLNKMKIVHGPRPKGKILPSQLPQFEDEGKWLVQRKFNGHKNTFFYDGKTLQFCNKGKHFLRYKTPPLFLDQLSALKIEAGGYWFDSELLDVRVSDTIVLYDVLQVAGTSLIGTSQEERLELLEGICRVPKRLCSYGVALQVTENIWLAERWNKDFTFHYEEYLHLDLIEGLVLRDKLAPLDNFGLTAYETGSQIRCRKESKNYRF